MPRWQRAYSPSGVIYKWSVWPRALKKPDKKNPTGVRKTTRSPRSPHGYNWTSYSNKTTNDVYISISQCGTSRSAKVNMSLQPPCRVSFKVPNIITICLIFRYSWKKNVCFVSKLQAFSTIEEKSIGQKLTSHLLDFVYTTSVKKSSWMFHWKQHESTRILFFFLNVRGVPGNSEWRKH